MKPYPAYRNIGLEFLESIPADWGVARLKHLSSVNFSNVDKHTFEEEIPVRLCNYVDVYKNDFITPDMDFMRASATEAEIKKFTLRKSDVLITKDSESWEDIAVPAYVTHDLDGVLCGYHLAQIRSTGIYGKFLFWVLCSSTLNDQYKVEAHGITRYGLGKDSIENSVIPIPSFPEQQAIADFLDCKTAQIDTLIEKEQRQIDLLQEQRTALINHVVTKGVNPNVPMKESGVEWLEEIPSHWENIRLKFLTREIIDTEHKTAPFYDDGEYFVVRTSNIRNGKLLFENAKYTNMEGYQEWTRRGLPEPGDVIFTREAPAGEACIVPEDLPIVIGQRTVLLRLKKDIFDAEFCIWSIYGGVTSQFIKLLSQGSTVAHFNMSDIQDMPFLVPSLEEQKTISSFITSATKRIDSGINKILSQINNLRSYRTALISEAVTGKIDVREWKTVHE